MVRKEVGEWKQILVMETFGRISPGVGFQKPRGNEVDTAG